MVEKVCCVCHRPVGDDAKILGGRPYCARHFAKVTQDRPGVWRAGLGMVAGQLLLVLVVEVLAGAFDPVFSGWTLVAAGVGLALLSAVIWLIFFYRQDRLEPEPKGYVLSIFLLGALLAQGVGIPLVRDVLEVQRWLPRSPVGGLLAAILIIGFVQEFLKYAAVRYAVFPLPEFDERVDGVIYGTAAGLGYATVLNINYVVAGSGVNLQAGVIRIVVTSLAQASFAGLTGYFLGRAKFEDEPVWWLPAGVTLAAVLNGVFTTLRGELTTTGLGLAGGGFNPWPGLALAAVVAGGTFAALFALIRRANKLTLAWADAASTASVEGGAP